jgi:ABC-type multidrug transport system ATPase subunit
MIIGLEQISKKYHKDWIFKNVSLQFQRGTSYAITGPNGSGKSTLLQLIAGNILPTKGMISYTENNVKIDPDRFFNYISFAAPYLELPEEFTLEEFLKFHFNFKNCIKGIKLDDLPSRFNLRGSETKFIRNFSTGMKQRLKLGIALVADTPVVLLDEPATNLDSEGVKWYREEMRNFKEDRLLIVSSNRIEEFDFCQEHIDIVKYKVS